MTPINEVFLEIQHIGPRGNLPIEAFMFSESNLKKNLNGVELLIRILFIYFLLLLLLGGYAVAAKPIVSTEKGVFKYLFRKNMEITKEAIMIRFIRSVSILTILIFVVFLAGCAFGTRHPTLTYPPESDSSGTSVAHAAVKPTPKNVQIVLIPFTDQRSDKKLVGTVRNAYGMRTAEVIPTNSVEDWVTQAVSTELQNNGYTVVRGTSNDDTSASSSTVVSGEILNVFL